MPVLRVASEEYLDKEDAENSIYRYIYHGIRPMIPPRSLSVSHYLMRGIERQVTDTLKAANFGVGGFLTAEEEDLKRLLDERAHLLKGCMSTLSGDGSVGTFKTSAHKLSSCQKRGRTFDAGIVKTAPPARKWCANSRRNNKRALRNGNGSVYAGWESGSGLVIEPLFMVLLSR